MGWWWSSDDRPRRHDDVSTAEVARTLTRHMDDCVQAKLDIHQKLDQHGADADRKHEENLTRFAKIDRTIYIATGIAMAVVWAMTHGGDVLAKIMK